MMVIIITNNNNPNFSFLLSLSKHALLNTLGFSSPYILGFLSPSLKPPPHHVTGFFLPESDLRVSFNGTAFPLLGSILL